MRHRFDKSGGPKQCQKDLETPAKSIQPNQILILQSPLADYKYLGLRARSVRSIVLTERIHAYQDMSSEQAKCLLAAECINNTVQDDGQEFKEGKALRLEVSIKPPKIIFETTVVTAFLFMQWDEFQVEQLL
ncbi:unnamed protein product [Enterobius vermicularis]|uniref:Uncharacterized protein n=1 Tax=Enterobius vermicularis TaxID=51028 RepID=A0A0N4UZ40_ENTVE|nr:unnamed protein product [Enterobius vermicularis]